MAANKLTFIRNVLYVTEKNFCESQPCLNGGNCEISADGYKCHCDSGFIGDKCEHGI